MQEKKKKKRIIPLSFAVEKGTGTLPEWGKAYSGLHIAGPVISVMMNTVYLGFTVKYNQDDAGNASSSGKQQNKGTCFLPVKLMTPGAWKATKPAFQATT